MNNIKNFKEFLNEEIAHVDFDAKEKWYGLNSEWHKNNLPFKFKSPISGKEYNINRGNVRSTTNYGKSVYNVNLYQPSENINIIKNNIYSNDDIIIIGEGSDKKSFYIKNLEEKDIIYKIINDIKTEIEGNNN